VLFQLVAGRVVIDLAAQAMSRQPLSRGNWRMRSIGPSPFDEPFGSYFGEV
jgi:hypothetical protein